MGMKIQEVKIKNFKVLKDIQAEINGKSIFLMAENGRGKSSFMQAIEIALGKNSAIPKNMGGEGEVHLTKDGLPYIFNFKTGKDGKAKLTVTMPNGLKEDKKGIISGIIGSLDFDIEDFVRKSETTAGRKEQVNDFKKLLPQEFIEGIKVFETKVKNLYDERTEVNRKAETLEGFIKESPLFGADLKTQPVDITALSLQIDKAKAFNDKIKGAEQRFKDREESLKAKEQRLLDIDAEIAKLMEESAEVKRQKGSEETIQNQAEKWLSENKPIDTAPLLTSLSNASETNVMASKAVEHNKKLKDLEQYKEISGDLTVQIETNKQCISDAIKDFDSPVEGLSFDDEQLIYNGVPVSDKNLSTSEIIHLGIKMKFASNPDFGIIFIEHGESLGEKRLKEILELSKKYDLQLFIEEVVRGKDELSIEFINE